jgi:hypothetical protein
VKGKNLELVDRVALGDGEEVVVSISEPLEAKNLDALRRAAGGWKGMLDPDALIANIYADRLGFCRPWPNV